VFFFFSSRRRHTRFSRDWSSDVCSSDLARLGGADRLRCLVAAGERGLQFGRQRAAALVVGNQRGGRRRRAAPGEGGVESFGIVRSEERRGGEGCEGRGARGAGRR